MLSVQSLNSEICPKPAVLCPKSVQSQNVQKKRIGLRKKINQSVIIKKSQLPPSLQMNFKVSWGMVNKKS